MPDHVAPAGQTAAISESGSRRRILRRDEVRALVHVASVLAPRDAALIRALYHHEVHIRDLALALQLGESSLRRRVKRILNRLHSPLLHFVIRQAHAWPADRRQIAHAVILRAEPIQSVARRMGLTRHAVRLQLLCIKNLCDENLRPE